MSQTQAKQPIASDTVDVTHTLGHWMRMIICFCTFGFVYPNAFVEGMDLTNIQRGYEDTLDAD